MLFHRRNPGAMCAGGNRACGWYAICLFHSRRGIAGIVRLPRAIVSESERRRHTLVTYGQELWRDDRVRSLGFAGLRRSWPKPQREIARR